MPSGISTVVRMGLLCHIYGVAGDSWLESSTLGDDRKY
jgi:hypothetical protein